MNSGLKTGVIKSIRGNRLHIFFQQCEIHCSHYEIFINYLQSKCPKNIDFLAKLLHDYKLDMAHDQFQAAGIMSQVISRPWMKKFYRSAESSYSHMDAFTQVRIYVFNEYTNIML